MATERQLRETVQRCVSMMVYDHEVGRSGRAGEMMVAEVQLIAAFVADELRLDDRQVEEAIVGPLGAELAARFGHEAGARLLGEFIDAFEHSDDGLAVGRERRG